MSIEDILPKKISREPFKTKEEYLAFKQSGILDWEDRVNKMRASCIAALRGKVLVLADVSVEEIADYLHLKRFESLNGMQVAKLIKTMLENKGV
jgi:hypothetical protein